MRFSLLLPAMSVAAALNGPQTAILRAPSQVGLRADLRAMAMAAEWEEYAGGCQLLRPDGEPRALVHFLGGVFVSPAPQVAYRYMLESLSRRGYVVVATPFAVDFDYRKPAADIHKRFGVAKAALTSEYGDLPQMAMGHSLGALMQVLLCCLYPEYARACQGAALLSYNNKPVSDAIPLFREVLVPSLAPLEPLTRPEPMGDAIRAVAGLRRGSFALARQLNAYALNPLVLLGQAVGVRALGEAADAADRALRDAEALAALADQVPEVLSSISRGVAEFSPSPDEVRALLGTSYTRPAAPLVVQFTVDSLDESPQLLRALPALARARSLVLPGTHLTPLAVDPFAFGGATAAAAAADLSTVRASLLAEVDALVDAVDGHFDEVVATARFATADAAAKQESALASASQWPAAEARVAEARVTEARQLEASITEAKIAEAAAAEEAAIGAAEAAVQAAAAEVTAKAQLEVASQERAAAQQRAFVAYTKAAVGSVVPPTSQARSGRRISRLKELSRAREAAEEAEGHEAALEGKAREAAVLSRIAEVEALADGNSKGGA